MNLTPNQQRRFWREWSLACRTQGWTRELGLTDAEITAHRHELLARAGFTSLTQVDKLAGFDRLLSGLSALHHPSSIRLQVRLANMPRTRLLFAIEHLARQLSTAYVESAPLGSAYLASIMLDRWGHYDLDRLSLDDLQQLRNTLAARRSAHRRRDAESADRNSSLTSEETFPDQVAFTPDPETTANPF